MPEGATVHRQGTLAPLSGKQWIIYRGMATDSNTFIHCTHYEYVYDLAKKDNRLFSYQVLNCFRPAVIIIRAR